MNNQPRTFRDEVWRARARLLSEGVSQPAETHEVAVGDSLWHIHFYDGEFSRPDTSPRIWGIPVVNDSDLPRGEFEIRPQPVPDTSHPLEA